MCQPSSRELARAFRFARELAWRVLASPENRELHDLAREVLGMAPEPPPSPRGLNAS